MDGLNENELEQFRSPAEREVERLLGLNAFDDNTVEHTTEEWHAIGLIAAAGYIELLDWLLATKKIPLLLHDSKTGFNLLHIAVINDQYEIMDFLIQQENTRSLLMHRSKEGLTPFETAILTEEPDLILAFVGKGFENMYEEVDFGAGTDQWASLASVVERTRFDEEVYHLLYYNLRYFRVRDFTLSLAGNRVPDVTTLSWWSPDSWTPSEQSHLYHAFKIMCKNGDLTGVTFLLEKAGVTAQPPELYDWEKISAADGAALGDWTYERSIKPYQEFSPLVTLFGAYIRNTWDGDLEKLGSVLEEIFKNENERRGLGKSNVIMRIRNPPTESRFDVVKLIASRLPVDGAVCLPRLDLLVEGGQLEILKWLADKEYLNLEFVLRLRTRLMEEGDEANETPEDDGEDDDDVCAICISAKQHPFELNCRHSFCQACIQDYFHAASDQGRQYLEFLNCPMCMGRSTPPVLLTIASRLSSCIIDEHSWMPMFDEICIGQVLLGLAAGMDSPYVFAWLVLEQSMNPRTTFFDNGNTVLHIAASQGSVMVIVWLLKNGFADLADMQNADGKQAVHCTITSKTHTANFILSIFASIQNEHPLPVDWMEHALASEDKFIVDMANEVIRQRIRQGMRSLFESSVSVDDIMKACEEGEYTTCTSCLLSESDGYTEMGSETFLKLIFEFSRHDVLKAFFRLEISSRCFWSKTASDVFAPLLDSCKNDELRKVAEGIVFREETSRKVARKINEFNDVLKKGGTVEEVDKITREQDELIKQLEAADPEQEFYTTKSCRQYASISFDMLFMAGQNPLEYCISINRLDFVDWILQKWTPDLSDLEKALRPHCLAKANLPTLQHIMKLYETHHRPLDVFGKTLSTLISTYMLRSSRLEEDSDEKEKYEHTLQKVEFLAKHPGIDLNSLRSDDRYALNYCTKPWFTSSEDTMRMVKLLVENGADPMITSYRAERRTVLEDFVGCLSSTTLPVVRWLALEKGYDVRFLEPSVYEDDWKKHTAILEEFALIQAAQQTMFDKKSEP